MKKILGFFFGRFQKSLTQKKYFQWTRISKGIILFSSTFMIGTLSLITDKAIETLKEDIYEERRKLMLQFGQMTVYPQINCKRRSNVYEISFDIDQRKCEMLSLVTSFLSCYNDDKEKDFTVTNMKAHSNNGVSTTVIQFTEREPAFKAVSKGTITISGVVSQERASFKFIFEKENQLTPRNHRALKAAYKEGVRPKAIYSEKTNNQNKQESGLLNQARKLVTRSEQNRKEILEKLKAFGVQVFEPNSKEINLDWDYLAGYELQKRQIEDTVLLALTYPTIYDEITEQTRVKFEVNRPKAVLFEGPPGTGKTTSAKIIAQQVNIPLIYMPIEAIMSKFYGESEQKLADMWELCRTLGKVIIFIDEIDALAVSRNSDIHQASRRILSTLLRKIDSFQSTTDVLLICATNRKKDLDAAMLSRIDLSVIFHLPDLPSRAAIFQRYAKHLSPTDLKYLAEQTSGFSGRNISDVCKNAERKWASKVIRKETEVKLPPLNEYIESLIERKNNDLA